MPTAQGSVIDFASGAGLEGQQTQGAYAAAKEAIRAISRVAANEWAPDNINVNIISPPAPTEGIEANPGVENVLLAKAPLHRFGDPESDIGVAVFLADASDMTGRTLMVDGGSIKLR